LSKPSYTALREQITIALRQDLAQARRLARRYAALADKSGDPIRVAEAEVQHAKVDFLRHDLKRAVERFARARRRFKRAGETLSVVMTDISAAQALALSGDARKARRLLAEMLRVKIREPALAARVEIAAGRVHSDLGDEKKAEAAFRRALDRVGRRSSNETAAARAGLALCLTRRGATKEALRQTERARVDYQRIGFQNMADQLRLNRAWILAWQGDAAEAFDEFARARAAFEAVGDRRWIALTRQDEAELRLRLGDAVSALDLSSSAAGALAKLGAVVESGRARLIAARAAGRLGKEALAHRHATRARAAFLEGRDPAGAAVASVLCGIDLARSEKVLRDHGHAVGALEARLARARAAGGHRGAALLADGVRAYPVAVRRWLSPHLHRMRGMCEPKNRIRHLRLAVRAAESVRDLAPTGALRAATLWDQAESYEALVQALLDRGRPADLNEAFVVLDSLRARTLREEMEREAPGISGTARSRDMRRRLEVLWSALEREERGGGLRGVTCGILNEVTQLEERYRVRADHLDGRRASPPSAALPRGPCLAFAVLAGHVHALLAHDGRVDTWSCGTLDAIRGHAADFQFQVTRRLHGGGNVADATRPLEALGSLFFSDAPPELAELEGITIVPAPELGDVVFEALFFDGEPWLDRCEIVYAPTAAAPRTPKRRTGAALVVGLKDDSLPAVEKEIRSVKRQLGGADVVAGAHATKARLLREMAGRPLIHLAGHARASDVVPALSALRVADGWLAADDLAELPLSGTKIVLSACRTGDPSLLWHGESLAGFPRALLAAGAEWLIASRWEVPDGSAETWMSYYYRNDGSRTPARSVRTAARAIRRRYPHPADWAAFLAIRGGSRGR